MMLQPMASMIDDRPQTKNGTIVRKHLGYSHIPSRFATQVNAFCRDYLKP